MASRRIRSLLSPSRRTRSGTAAAASGPIRPRAMTTSARTLSFFSFEQAAEALDRRLADGREGKGRAIVLVRLLLPLPP